MQMCCKICYIFTIYALFIVNVFLPNLSAEKQFPPIFFALRIEGQSGVDDSDHHGEDDDEDHGDDDDDDQE